MLVETQIEILNGQSSGLFSNEIFEKRPVMTVQDFVLYSNDHFESYLVGDGLNNVSTLRFDVIMAGNGPSCSVLFIRDDVKLSQLVRVRDC